MQPQAEPRRSCGAAWAPGRKGPVVAELMALPDAVDSLVSDGDSVALEGFTHLIPFAAGHEMLRQGRRELELIRMTPDLLYDQMIGMGAARKLVFSYGGNPGVGSLHRFRDAIEHDWPQPIEIEEHSHAGMANRYVAGAAELPFAVMRGYVGTDLVAHTRVAPITCPFTGEQLAAVPALRPDVAIVHAQEADRDGNVQLWGIPGVQKEAVLAAQRSLVTVERIVERLEPRPGGVVIPGLGDRRRAPSARAARSRPTASGITERDNDFYRFWDEISRDRDAFAGVDGRARARGGWRDAMTATGRRDRARCRRSSRRAGCATRGRCSSASGGRARRRSWRGWSTTPSWCWSTSRGRSAPSRSTSRSRSATASSPRPPTRSCRVPEMFNYWIGPGRIDVAFLGAAQVDRYANLNSTVIGDYDHPAHAAARGRRRAGDRRQLRRGDRDRARTPGARSSSAWTSARPSASATARARASGSASAARADRGDHRPRRARARPRDQGAHADPDPRGRRASSRCARRPAGSSSRRRAARHRAADRPRSWRRCGSCSADERRLHLRGGAHAVRSLRRRARGGPPRRSRGVTS